MADAHVDAPSLIVRGGPLDGHEEKLKEGLTVIVGSGRLANLRLDHPDIELAHVKVRWDEMGLSMVDNGSRKGTWLNGVPVETAGLLDGDVIEFTAPEEKRGAPCVLLKVPAGSVSEAPLPLQAPPPDPAPAPAPAGSLPKPRGQAVRPRGPAARRGRARPGLRLPDLRIVGLAVAALALVVAVWLGSQALVLHGAADRVDRAAAGGARNNDRDQRLAVPQRSDPECRLVRIATRPRRESRGHCVARQGSSHSTGTAAGSGRESGEGGPGLSSSSCSQHFAPPVSHRWAACPETRSR